MIIDSYRNLRFKNKKIKFQKNFVNNVKKDSSNLTANVKTSQVIENIKREAAVEINKFKINHESVSYNLNYLMSL